MAGPNDSTKNDRGSDCGCKAGGGGLGIDEGAAPALGKLPLHVLQAGEDRVEILLRGAAVTSWLFRDGRELLDGYRSEAEALQLEGYRNAVLAPWSNRIRDAVFEFDGTRYDHGVDPSGIREALHGLIADKQFEVVAAGTDADGCPVPVDGRGAQVAWVRLACRLEPSSSYPWPLQIETAYALVATDSSQLALRLSAKNLADSAAPVTLGWHPYLTHLGDPRRAHVTVGAKLGVCTGDDNIPLAGEGAFKECAGLDVTGPQQMDDAFTQLEGDCDGMARATVRHEDGSATELRAKLPIDQRGCGIIHVFTGECLPQRGGEAIAVEPCLMMTDAFNRDECADAVPLASGQTRVLEAALTFRLA